MTELWKIDNETYIEIQKLKRFVDFIARLELANTKDKENCEAVKKKITEIDNPENNKYWNVALRIHISQPLANLDDNTPYLKAWDVTYENYILEITTKELTANDSLDMDYGENFNFSGIIHFKKAVDTIAVYLSNDIDLFVDDATNYKKYLRADFDDVDIDVDI